MRIPKTLRKSEVFGAWTTSSWTRSFRHLLSYNRHWDKRATFRDPQVKSVKPKDRIKYWNIVPGDQVRVIGEVENTVYEVLSINRLSNQVKLRVPATSERGAGKKIQYSNLQLFVGHHEFPLEPEQLEVNPVPSVNPAPVFATRLSTNRPKWNPIFRRWDWQRFAVNTMPRLPTWTGDRRDRINIPWPVPTPRERGEPSLYDTSKDAVTEITYTPPAFPANPRLPLPKPPSEHEYIKFLSTPEKSTFKESLPMELNVVREISNPHSRAKKQKRWQAQQEYQRDLLQQFVKAELKNLKGRTRREARAEAAFKWKQKLVEDRKAEFKRRWQKRGQEAKLLRKRARAVRKEEKRGQRLANLVLQQGDNQVLPLEVS